MASDKIYQTLPGNQIPMLELEKALEQLGFGTTTLSIRVHDKKVTDIVGHVFENRRFRVGENAEATSLVLTEIQNTFKAKKSGSYTFTLIFEKGDIRNVNFQRALRRSYRWDKTGNLEEEPLAGGGK
jgi:hypothetical protein